MRSSSTTSTLNALALDKYSPEPIILALIPDIASISSFKLPKIASAVTAVCASNGVGAGLMRPRLA